jgi:hypothetical protein
LPRYFEGKEPRKILANSCYKKINEGHELKFVCKKLVQSHFQIQEMWNVAMGRWP